jgi:hypothetical protein
MLYLVIKAAISGVIVALVSEVARRYPGWGGLIASLPLTSLLAMIWLWRDTGDSLRIAELSSSIFWFILPSLPLFLVLPALLRSGMAFWVALAIVVAGTLALYALMFWAGPRLGLKI